VPVQDRLTPWDQLADAYERLHDAERHGGDVDAAREEVERAKEAMTCLGQLLIVSALNGGGTLMGQTFARYFGGVFGVTREAADSAKGVALKALRELDAMRERVKYLERMVANVTPGIGEPGLVR